MKMHSCHFLVKQFQMGGTICLWYLYPYIYWYFLIFSNKLTVSNGFSLTVCKCLAVTFSSSSFKWGGPSAFGICILIYTGISWYLPIIWLFRMGTHWPLWKHVAVTFLSSSFKWGGPSAFGIYMFSLQWYFLISSYYLTVLNGGSLTALKSIEVTQSSGSFSWGGPSAFGVYMFSLCAGISLFDCFKWALIDCIVKCRGHSELWQFHWGGSICLWCLHVLVFPYLTVSNGCSLTAL